MKRDCVRKNYFHELNWDLVLGKRCFSTIHCPIKRFIIFCICRWPEVSVDLYFVHQNTLGPLIFSTLRSTAVTKIYDLQHQRWVYHVSSLCFFASFLRSGRLQSLQAYNTLQSLFYAFYSGLVFLTPILCGPSSVYIIGFGFYCLVFWHSFQILLALVNGDTYCFETFWLFLNIKN